MYDINTTQAIAWYYYINQNRVTFSFQIRNNLVLRKKSKKQKSNDNIVIGADEELVRLSCIYLCYSLVLIWWNAHYMQRFGSGSDNEKIYFDHHFEKLNGRIVFYHIVQWCPPCTSIICKITKESVENLRVSWVLPRSISSKFILFNFHDFHHFTCQNFEFH